MHRAAGQHDDNYFESLVGDYDDYIENLQDVIDDATEQIADAREQKLVTIRAAVANDLENARQSDDIADQIASENMKNGEQKKTKNRGNERCQKR